MTNVLTALATTLGLWSVSSVVPTVVVVSVAVACGCLRDSGFGHLISYSYRILRSFNGLVISRYGTSYHCCLPCAKCCTHFGIATSGGRGERPGIGDSLFSLAVRSCAGLSCTGALLSRLTRTRDSPSRSASPSSIFSLSLNASRAMVYSASVSSGRGVRKRPPAALLCVDSAIGSLIGFKRFVY